MAPVHPLCPAPAPLLAGHAAKLSSSGCGKQVLCILSTSWHRNGKRIRADNGDAASGGKKPVQSNFVHQRNSRPLQYFSLREAKLDEELWAAAWLRAESYSEDGCDGRHVESHKRSFAEQEFSALKRRVYGRAGQSIKCVCFIAVMDTTTKDVDETSMCSQPMLTSVIGTLDISCRQVLPGEPTPSASRTGLFPLHPSQMPRLQRYAYISNVCVSKLARRNGVASRLLQASAEVAKQWGLTEIYVHVLPTNIAAQRLYAKHGFHIVHAPVAAGHPLLLSRTL